MTLKVEVMPSYRIVYVRQVGPYGPANVQAMNQLKEWAVEHELMQYALLFGVPQDDPATTPSESCRYDACMVIEEDYKLDGSIAEGRLAGGQYAVFTIEHTAEGVQRAWNDIFPALQASGYQLDHKPILERYSYEMLSQDYCELCVPIKAVDQEVRH